MANRIIRPGRGAWNPNQKPPYGARLNPFHPLSQGLVGAWLFNEGGGVTIYDLAGMFGRTEIGPGSGRGFVWDLGGLKFIYSTYFKTNIPQNVTFSDLTVAFCINPTSSIGSFTLGGTWGNFFYQSYANGSAYCGTDVGTRFDTTDIPAGTIKNNLLNSLVYTRLNGTGYFYNNGSLISQKSQTASSNPWPEFLISNLNESAYTYLYNLYIWTRGLNASQVLSLHANPYQMFWHPVYNDLITTAGIFLKTDYWSITAAPQMVANISVISAFLGILVSAVVSATSTVVASLNLVEIIRATISAVSNVIAALGIRRFISAIITAASSVIANIRSSKFVSAVISAVSSMAANLRLSKFVSAIVSSTSNVIAAIKLNKIIIAIISATSSMAANLRLQKIISAIISTTSNVIANIRSSKFISAIVSAVSSMAANLRLSKFVSVIVLAASSMAANLRLSKFVSAIISGTSNVIAALNARKAIAAIISAVSSMYGNLTTVGRIMISSIIIAATTGVEAAIWTRKVISATISAISSMYGNITAVALRFISATISATSNVYGNITVALQLAISATIGALSSVSANIFAIRAIAAIITAATNVIASLHAIFSIKAVITGVSGMIADIYKAGVGPVVTAGRHLIGYLKRKIEKAINDFLHIE